MATVIPPFTLVTLARGGAGPSGLAINVGAAALLILVYLLVCLAIDPFNIVHPAGPAR